MNSKSSAALASAFSAKPGIPAYIAWNDVEGELVLFDTRDGSYHALNATASSIWRGIARGQLPAQIACECAAQFSVDGEQAEAEVLRFTANALVLGLLALEEDAS